MARIQVQFGVTQRTSQSGNEYYLIEMRTTDKNGNYRELPDVKMTPFSARLLLEHLPELCDSIKEGERLKEMGGPPPQAGPQQQTVQQGGPFVAPAEAVVGPDGLPQQFASPQQTQQTAAPTVSPGVAPGAEEEVPF